MSMENINVQLDIHQGNLYMYILYTLNIYM